MKHFEVGTQQNKQLFDCLNCAKREADIIMSLGNKVYVKDTYHNKIVYGNYFELVKRVRS